jgi:transposase-like protein
MDAIHHISSDFAEISPATLPPTQAQVVAALATGQTITAAAREAGIHRTTIHHWLRNEPAFKTAVEAAQSEYTATLNDEMRELSAHALAALRSLHDDSTTPPSVRLRAALAVLERPQFPDQGWSLPERIESPLRQQVLDDMADVEADYKVMRMTNAVESHAAKADPPQTEPAPEPSDPHNPQTTTHYQPSHPPPSRCAPCPCGSGLKYKRCCARSSNAARAA